MNQQKQTMQAGDRLPNGAVVIIRHGDVVLCYTGEETLCSFVTWRINEKGHAFWGHYHEDLESAVAEFYRRAEKKV